MNPILEKYSNAPTGTGGPGAFLNLGKLAAAVNDAASALRSNPTAENNNKYKAALQTFLNHRAYVIQSAHEKYIISGDMKEDWKLTADGLLSVSELKLINASIKPIQFGETRPRAFVPQRNRQKLQTWAETLELARQLDKINADNPIADLPDNWEYVSFEQQLRNPKDALVAPDGTRSSALRDEVPAQIAQIIDRLGALSPLEEFMTPGSARISDNSGTYQGVVTINSGRNGGRVATDEEINAMLASMVSAGNIMHLPGTAGSIAAGDIIGDAPMNMFITDSGRELRIKVAANGPEKPGSLAIAYANGRYGITVFVNKAREAKRSIDSGANKAEGSPFDHFSTNIAKNSMEIWDHVVTHEVGHVVAARNNVNVGNETRGITAPSTYGRQDADEKFAELFAKYMRGEAVSPVFMDILRKRGLLKSQRNN